MAQDKIDIEEYTAQCNEFHKAFESVQLATASAAGQPEASYAPYVKIDNDFYIYVSELSRHTANMMENDNVSMIFIETEKEAKHLFARRRLTYRAKAEEIMRGTDVFNLRMDDFEARFGKFINMLRNLEDFHLFRLEPVSGTYVAGFARAFDLVGDNLDVLKHVNDVGHKSADKKTEKQMEAAV